MSRRAPDSDKEATPAGGARGYTPDWFTVLHFVKLYNLKLRSTMSEADNDHNLYFQYRLIEMIQ